MSLDRRLEAGIAVGDHKTSMLQDLEAGKRLELGCMTGAVVELAGRLGVDVPHLRTVHACATLLDQLNRGPAADRGQRPIPPRPPAPAPASGPPGCPRARPAGPAGRPASAAGHRC